MRGRLVGAQLPRRHLGQAARALGAHGAGSLRRARWRVPGSPRGLAVLLHRQAAWPALPRGAGKPEPTTGAVSDEGHRRKGHPLQCLLNAARDEALPGIPMGQRP